jgi:hypothetical protein
VPSSSGLSRARISGHLLAFLDYEGEGIVILQNMREYLQCHIAEDLALHNTVF